MKGRGGRLVSSIKDERHPKCIKRVDKHKCSGGGGVLAGLMPGDIPRRWFTFGEKGTFLGGAATKVKVYLCRSKIGSASASRLGPGWARFRYFPVASALGSGPAEQLQTEASISAPRKSGSASSHRADADFFILIGFFHVLC